MMASHRPSDLPSEQPSPLPEDPAANASAVQHTASLEPSRFLRGFDWALALGVLVLAFFSTSFSIRNTDLWMHLATGRMLVAGGYSFGVDPFSFATADQYWTNHAWLFDFISHQLYKMADGRGLAAAKAILFVLLAGLMLLVRRPGQSVYIFVVMTGLAFLAAAPRLLFQPTMASFVLLVGMILLLVRCSKPANSWKFPVIAAIMCAAWSNLDQWFFIGPAMLFLYAVGQFIRPDEGTDSTTALKAVVLGALACMVNPHHIHVWTFPAELVNAQLAQTFKGDLELGPMFRSGASAEAFDFTANPVNPTALVLLIVCGLGGFASNLRHCSLGLALIWIGVLVLALAHLRAIPFFAFAAAPIAAINLSAAVSRLGSKQLSDGTLRSLQTLQTMGRGVVGLAGVLLIAASYAGWLHPFNSQRRWNWDLEPDVSLQRASEQIHAWRTAGTLPAEARVMNFQPDLANYIAWFAPGQKTFFDNRVGLHELNAEEYVRARKYLAPRSITELAQSDFDFTGFLRKHEITYAVTSHPLPRYNKLALEVMWIAGPNSEWALWHVAGRAVILGWQKQTASPAVTIAALRLDPLKAAFFDSKEPPTPVVRQPLPARDIWERYLQEPAKSPAESEEAQVLLRYRQSLTDRHVSRFQFDMNIYGFLLHRMHGMGLIPGTGGWFRRIGPDNILASIPNPPEIHASSLLAVRAARRAIAASPDHPDGYFMLAQAYGDASYIMNTDIRNIVVTSNIMRFLARLPDDPRRRITSLDIQDGLQLAARAHHIGIPSRFDLKLEVTMQSVVHLRQEIEDYEQNLPISADEKERESREKILESMRKELATREKAIGEGETALKRSSDAFVNESASISSPLERAATARRYGLIREAIKELYRAHQLFQKQLQNEDEKKRFTATDIARQLAEHAELIELMLYSGQAEEAARILDTIDSDDSLVAVSSPEVRREFHQMRYRAAIRLNPNEPYLSRHDSNPIALYRALRQAVALSLGQFDQAIQAQTKEAEQAQREYDQFVSLNFPKGPPKLSQELLKSQLDKLFASLAKFPANPVRATIESAEFGVETFKSGNYISVLQNRVDAHTRLGLTYLEMGRVGGQSDDKREINAAHHFRQVIAAPDLPSPPFAVAVAKEYLGTIERIHGKKGK